MPIVRTSIGQACSNAVAAWLTSQLPDTVLVQARWPEDSVVAPGVASGKTAVITVYRQGKRTGADVLGRGTMASSQAIPNTNPQQYYLLMEIGQVTQPLQLDVWCTTDLDRDQTIDMLDDALNVGWNDTLGPVGTSGVGWAVTANDDPVRDGMVLALNPNDGYAGLASILFDLPEIQDDAESVATSNYRAFYPGNAMGVFSRVTDGYLIKTPKFSPTTQGG